MEKFIERKVSVYFPEDSINKGKEQYVRFQKDGRTVEIPYNRNVEVPYWVAIRAVKIGLIDKSVLPEDLRSLIEVFEEEDK